MLDEHAKSNKELWNNLAKTHINSKFYDLAGFIKGRSSLTSIELDLLGDVKGKSVLHLQCHFGMDTLSLARLGAQVTGVDFSDVAIAKARELNDLLNLKARFVLCDVNTLDQHLDGKFDIVFASFGVLSWHSDLKRWASIASHFLKETGTLHLAEFHPVLSMLNDNQTAIGHSYFNQGPIVVTNQVSYADPAAGPAGTEYGWNHALGEIFAALEATGLHICNFREYDFSPFNIFANPVGTDRRYRIKGFEGIIPLIYSLSARMVPG